MRSVNADTSNMRRRITCLALVLIALPAASAGCGRGNANKEETKETPAASASQSSAAPGGLQNAPRKKREAASDDRFDAKIAENIAKVPNPEVTIAESSAGSLDNTLFRDRTIEFVRKVSLTEKSGEPIVCDLPITSTRPFRAVVWGYRDGAQVARGEASNERLCIALKDATRQAVASKLSAGDSKESLADTRLAIELPEQGYSILEFGKKGLELDHGVVPLRSLDKALVEKRIDDGQAYLLRVLDPKLDGAHKYYYAQNDSFEPELHSIYTASTALTLLKLYAKNGDAKLLERAKRSVEFLKTMQSTDERDHTSGGFFYTFDLQRGKPEKKLVVGTTSKSIFTLLELSAVTKDSRYLDMARRAADWLISMQLPSGASRSYLTQNEDGPWTVHAKESTLYTGQVLSALSRTYRATKDTKYLDAAAKTAMYLATKVEGKNCYVGDEYRKPNPVSSSWLVLSLLDFAKATSDKRFEDIVFRCSRELVGRQWRRPEDVYRHGRWKGSLSSSGTGWLAEVMSEVYGFCREKGRENCDVYKEAVVFAVRQILQNTYSPENDFVVKNPKIADGGVFWSVRERYVRTDSVCHAMNAYLNILPHLDAGVLVSLPEKPISSRVDFDPELDKGLEAEDRSGGGDNDEASESSNDAPMSRAEDPDEEGGGKRPRRGPPMNGPPMNGPPMHGPRHSRPRAP